MNKYWKEHPAFRISLVSGLVVVGLVLVIVGWKMTGTLLGVGIMLVGVALLLAALQIYKAQFR